MPDFESRLSLPSVAQPEAGLRRWRERERERATRQGEPEEAIRT